jgi:pimeloyl-ACP methyl ester carboxylesterase
MMWSKTPLSLTLMLMISLLIACAPATTDKPADQPSAAGQVQANGITIAYESFGAPERETILLIGGTGQQLVDWPLELSKGLTDHGYRVVRYDNRDIGRSTHFTKAGLPDAEAIGAALKAGTPPPIPYTLQDMAADAVGLLDALNIQQAHIVGISMGGAIAQFVAIKHPERTRSLTLLMADSGNPAVPVVAKPEVFANVPPQPPAGDKAAFVEYQVKTWQALAGSTYPTDAATLRTRAQRDVERAYDPDGLTRQATVTLIDHLEPSAYRLNHLNTIKAPTVVLHGDDDPLVPIAAAHEIVAKVPGAELRIVPGLGHDIPIALVPQFVDAIAAAAGRAPDPA